MAPSQLAATCALAHIVRRRESMGYRDPYRGGGPHHPTADWGKPPENPAESGRGRMHAITLPHHFRDELEQGRARGSVVGSRPAGRTRTFAGVGPRRYRRPDAGILEDVALALTEDPHVDAGDVEVTVREAEVTLSGNIPDRAQRRRAEDIAWSVRGVVDVHNRLVLHRRAAHPADIPAEKQPPRVPQIRPPRWFQ
ncbi:MAG: BON domain-containing protein [Myxococcota bacterium]